MPQKSKEMTHIMNTEFGSIDHTMYNLMGERIDELKKDATEEAMRKHLLKFFPENTGKIEIFLKIRKKRIEDESKN
jgi:hypothetical protein